MKKSALYYCCLALMWFVIVGCSHNKPKDEKIDLESIKENRDNLDYRDNKAGIFAELDAELTAWQEAQRKRDHGYTSAQEHKLYELSCGYFSQLIEALTKDGTAEQTIATAALGFSEDIRAIPYLLGMLEKANPALRQYAAFSLGHIGSNQTPMKHLYQVLEQDQVDEVRGMAAFAISRIVYKDKDEGALPYLLHALQDKAPQVRTHVLIALGKLEHLEAARAIIATTITDPLPLVRQNSVWALGKIGGKETFIPLVKAMRDPVPWIAKSAYVALKKVTGKDLGSDPKKWEEWAGI